MHAAFLFSFVIFVLSFRGTTFCDHSGACVVPTKDDLKSVRGIPFLYFLLIHMLDFLYRLPKISFGATA